MKEKLAKLSKKFYDPLYDVITLKSRGTSLLTAGQFWAGASLRPQTADIENIIYDLIDTYEMNRLNFLKQSGLSYLFLPSATHTRFAHSLGTYYLGEQAAIRSWFQEGKDFIPLGVWLKNKGLLDDFLVALLLHDVGHFPFSHVLENNSCLYKIEPGSDQDPDIYFKHEDVACELIDPLGSNKYNFFSFFRERISKKSGGKINEARFLSNKLSKYNDINKDIIKYLISGSDDILEKIDIAKKKDVITLKNLTSGLIDLDRMDHYRRDSYFMGIKLSNFNVLGLLDDIILTYDGVKLKEDGINHALALLQGKENLVEGVFEDPTNVAYEAMLNNAIGTYVKRKSGYDESKILDAISKITFLTDEELFYLLQIEGDELITRLIFDLQNRQPFKQVSNSPFKVTNVMWNTRTKLEALKIKVATEFTLTEENKNLIIFRIPKGFRKEKKFDEWLDLEKLLDVYGNTIGQTSKVAEIEYFQRKQLRMPNFFNIVYAPEIDIKIITEIDTKINDYVSPK